MRLRLRLPGERLSRRLLDLASVFDYGFGKFGELRIEAAKQAEFDLWFVLVFGHGNRIPGAAKLLLPLRIGHHKRTKTALFFFFFCEGLLNEKRVALSLYGLHRILPVED